MTERPALSSSFDDIWSRIAPEWVGDHSSSLNLEEVVEPETFQKDQLAADIGESRSVASDIEDETRAYAEDLEEEQ